MACLTATFDRSYAQAWSEQGYATFPPKDGTKLDKLKNDVQTIFQRPTTGRTTRLGRKVEKPGDVGAAGPSGQHEATRHDKQHANK
jgi:hypothetical protein